MCVGLGWVDLDMCYMRLMRLRVNQIGLIVGLYECMRGVFIGYCWDFI